MVRKIQCHLKLYILVNLCYTDIALRKLLQGMAVSPVKD